MNLSPVFSSKYLISGSYRSNNSSLIIWSTASYASSQRSHRFVASRKSSFHMEWHTLELVANWDVYSISDRHEVGKDQPNRLQSSSQRDLNPAKKKFERNSFIHWTFPLVYSLSICHHEEALHIAFANIGPVRKVAVFQSDAIKKLRLSLNKNEEFPNFHFPLNLTFDNSP